jgi:ankyrin repeat protein
MTAVIEDSLDTVVFLLPVLLSTTSRGHIGIHTDIISAMLTAIDMNKPIDMIRSFLTAGVDVNTPLPNHSSLLHRSCLNSNADAVTLLISHGAHLLSTLSNQRFGPIELFAAVRDGNREIVRLLLDHPDTTPALLNRGTDTLSARDTHADTVIFSAVYCKHYLIARMLIDAGASARVTDSERRTPLMYASDAETVRLLVDCAPSVVEYQDARGWTALHHYANSASLSDALKELLISCKRHNKHICVDTMDNQHETALFKAIRNVNVEAVEILLFDNDADVRCTGFFSDLTALMIQLNHDVLL